MGFPSSRRNAFFIRDTLPQLGILLFVGLGVWEIVLWIWDIGLYGWDFRLRYNGDLWGKVFYRILG